MSDTDSTNGFFRLLYFLFAVCTGIVGYAINHSVFWAICDFLFSPFAWAKWLICKQVSLPIIKQAFSFFTG
jgi:hypothetical protein